MSDEVAEDEEGGCLGSLHVNPSGPLLIFPLPLCSRCFEQLGEVFSFFFSRERKQQGIWVGPEIGSCKQTKIVSFFIFSFWVFLIPQSWIFWEPLNQMVICCDLILLYLKLGTFSVSLSFSSPLKRL